MDPLAFCYWLKGFDEISIKAMPNEEQWNIIREHLSKVFNQEPKVKYVWRNGEPYYGFDGNMEFVKYIPHASC